MFKWQSKDVLRKLGSRHEKPIPVGFPECLHVSSQAVMNVNSRLRELYPDSEELFDVVLMTNNHAQVGVRLINSINHHGIK